MRFARKAEGVKVVEAAAPAVEETGTRTRASRERARWPKPVEHNRLSPFTDAMLLRVDGVDGDLLAFLRGMPQNVDAAAVLAGRAEDIDLAFLLDGSGPRCIWGGSRRVRCRRSPTSRRHSDQREHRHAGALPLRRRGGGSPLGRADRERVFAAYEEYRARLGKDGLRLGESAPRGCVSPRPARARASTA
jgi:hypothetical protein